MEENKNKITLSIGDVMQIAYWMESYRNPDKDSDITIEVTETGIGRAVKAYIEIDKGSGVWKDFTDYDNW